MVKFLQKQQDTQLEFALEHLEEHTVPYACHYNPYTLLTKNGELMQVIKIEGYSEDHLNVDGDDLRSTIRKAIIENIPDKKFAIWFHTIRRKKNLDSVNYYSSVFAKDVHDSWATKNHWRDKFVNELYITILYSSSSSEKENFKLSFTPKLLKQHHYNELSKNYSALDTVTEKIIDILKPFGGARLEVKYDSAGAHSEILEFLSKIICLRSKRVAIPIQSIDRVFMRSKVAFGGNSLEILDEHKKHFGAIFTIKEYHEFSAKTLDRFLGVATEYIISQTLNFVSADEATKSFNYFNYILGVSKDEDLRGRCGLADIMDGRVDGQVDYASQQMILMIIDDSLEDLQRSSTSVVSELAKLGIVVVREDLNIELCFWSQLPGNFHFFRRPSYINTKNSASFALLNNNPSGESQNIWGTALTLFRRKDGGPHFFNFHDKNIGHTIIAGEPKSFNKTLLHFLLSEATKYNPNILYIDQYETSKVLIKAIEGRHETLEISGEKLNFSFNPFTLADSPENQDFLKQFILYLAFPEGDATEEQKQYIAKILDRFFVKMPVGSRQLSMILDLIEDKTIYDNINQWCRPNELGILFDNLQDDFDYGTRIIGFDISKLTSNSKIVKAFISYCLHKYSILQNSSPVIVAIDDANSLLQNKDFAQHLPKLLDRFTANNGIVIFNLNLQGSINDSLKNIQEKIATHLLNLHIDYKIYQQAFNLDDTEEKELQTMKAINRNFMIKQKNQRVIVELNLDGIDYAIAAFEGNKDAVQAMEKAIAEHGDNANLWIIPFYKNLFPG